MSMDIYYRSVSRLGMMVEDRRLTGFIMESEQRHDNQRPSFYGYKPTVLIVSHLQFCVWNIVCLPITTRYERIIFPLLW